MAYYDAIAKGYNELYKEEQSCKLNIIKNNIKISQNAKILDVGCGTGISSDFEGFVVGIDPSSKLLKQNKNNRKLLGAAENLPFKNNTFDYVVSITAMHNFRNINKSIDEMKRVGRQGFVFSILRSSNKFALIKARLEKGFIIEKAVEEQKDTIFFCKKT